VTPPAPPWRAARRGGGGGGGGRHHAPRVAARAPRRARGVRRWPFAALPRRRPAGPHVGCMPRCGDNYTGELGDAAGRRRTVPDARCSASGDQPGAPGTPPGVWGIRAGFFHQFLWPYRPVLWRRRHSAALFFPPGRFLARYDDSARPDRRYGHKDLWKKRARRTPHRPPAAEPKGWVPTAHSGTCVPPPVRPHDAVRGCRANVWRGGATRPAAGARRRCPPPPPRVGNEAGTHVAMRVGAVADRRSPRQTQGLRVASGRGGTDNQRAAHAGERRRRLARRHGRHSAGCLQLLRHTCDASRRTTGSAWPPGNTARADEHYGQSTRPEPWPQNSGRLHGARERGCPQQHAQNVLPTQANIHGQWAQRDASPQAIEKKKGVLLVAKRSTKLPAHTKTEKKGPSKSWPMEQHTTHRGPHTHQTTHQTTHAGPPRNTNVT